MKNERRILCFGDSNTWGENPVDQSRYSERIRWTRRLEALLGGDYRVVEEGLQGRAVTGSGVGDPAIPRARPYLDHCVLAHKPIDAVIFALGINDLRIDVGATVEQIAEETKAIGQFILSSEIGPEGGSPVLLIMAPPLVGKLSAERRKRFVDAKQKGKALTRALRVLASQLGCYFIALDEIIQSSEEDGLHWDSAAHRCLAEHLASYLPDRLAGIPDTA